MSQDYNDSDIRNYEDMSREELVSLIGFEIDPSTARDELVMMAIDADNNRR